MYFYSHLSQIQRVPSGQQMIFWIWVLSSSDFMLWCIMDETSSARLTSSLFYAWNYFCVFTYVCCMHAHLYMDVSPCVCMWRSRQRATSLVITQGLPIVFFCLLETNFLPGQELSSRLDWLSSEPQESTCLSLPIPKIVSEYHHPRLFFIHTQVLMLARPHDSPS